MIVFFYWVYEFNVTSMLAFKIYSRYQLQGN